MEDNLKEYILRKIEFDTDREKKLNPEMFRAYPHRYTLNPTLTEEEIIRFEELHQIKLPKAYRIYLKEIGNGGHHKILPLKDTLKRRFPNSAIPKEYLKSEFSLISSIDRKDLEKQRYFTLKGKEKEQFWINALEGTIDIMDLGCGDFNVLVISGKERGMIWNDVMYAEEGIFNSEFSFLDLLTN